MLSRYSLFPIKDEIMWKFYKKHENAFWTANEMKFSQDIEDYNNLKPDLQHVIDMVNAFFSATDGIIIKNIMTRFIKEAITMEEMMFFCIQATIEGVHSETYSLIINTLVSDPDRRNNLFKAADNVPTVHAKDEWLVNYMNSNSSRSERLLAFACGEGIFFTSSFLIIFYFRSKGLLHNIVFANEQISKDEGLHRDVGLYLYQRDGKLSQENAEKIVLDAVDLECNFIDDMLPTKIDSLNPDEIKNYVRFLGDHLLISAGHQAKFNINANSLPTWMNDIAMEQKANFFEITVGNYKMSSNKQSIDWKSRINPNLNDNLGYDNLDSVDI
jgi:ribonucleoside-diphosphate reductase beta chain